LQGSRWLRRAATGAVAGITATAGLSVFAVAAHADSTFTLQRNFAGTDRYQTAGLFDAAAGKPSHVYLADGLPGHQADALAAAGWGGANSFGALLTDNTDTVPASTTSALSGNGVTSITILGGTAAVSQAQQNTLSGSYTVTRIAGATRFDTMQQLDDAIPTASVGKDSAGNPTAILASGNDNHLVDALSAGGVAYGQKFPIILTDSTSSTLIAQAQQVITALGIKHLIVVGGTASIPASQYTPAPTGVTKVDVTSGPDRSATSQMFSDFAIANGWATNTKMLLARGDDGADALASAPWAGINKRATCVTSTSSDPGSCASTTTNTAASSSPSTGVPTAGFAAEHASTLTGASDIAGGTSAVSSAAQSSVQTAGQSVASGGGTVAEPQLKSASILRTVTPAQSNAANPAGTYVQYVFTQAVSSATLNNAGFHIYDSSGDRCDAPAGFVAVDPSNSSAVDVVFNQASMGAAPCVPATTNPGSGNLTTTTGAATLTLATVGGPQDVGGAALTLPSGMTPDGSAAIGTASTVGAPTAHTTSAPDAVSWSISQTGGASTTPPNTFLNSTPINITFDQTAWAQTAAAAGTVQPGYPAGSSGFSIVLTSKSAAPVGAVGDEEACEGPAPTDNTTASGGTVPGGNGTTTLTIVCPNAVNASSTPLTASAIARVIIQADSVGTVQNGTGAPAAACPGAGATGVGAGGDVCNPLQAAASAHNATTDTPDLTGITVVPGNSSSGTADQIVYVFDKPVGAAGTNFDTAAGIANFQFYNSSGVTTTCSLATVAPAAGPPPTVPCEASVNPSNFNQVIVTVGKTPSGAATTAPTGTGVTLGIVGASVKNGAVTDPNNGNKNGDDELGTTNSNTPSTGVAPGNVAAPQLKSVHVAATTTVTGTTYSATYTFTQPVVVVAGTTAALHLYDADGTELTCNASAAAAATATNNAVVCTGFNQVVAGGAATTTQLQNAVLGTADYGAVTGALAVAGSGGTNSNNSPEAGVAQA